MTDSVQPRLRQWAIRIKGRREINVLIAIVILGILIYIRNSNFGTLFNIQVILRQVAIYGLLAIAQMLIIITAGIDLSVGSLVAFVGVVEALLYTKFSWSLPLILFAGLLTAVAIGFYHGIAVSKWLIPPFIITLGSLSIWRGMATGLTKSYPVLIDKASFRWLGQGQIWIVPVPVFILGIVALLLSYILNRTSFGRNIYAIGGNIEAARLSGIPVTRVLIITYSLASFLVGIAGTIVAGRLAEGLPSVGNGYELNAIAAAIIGGTSFFGGTGTVVGTLLGALLMSVIDNSLILGGISPYWYTLVVGTIIVLAVTIDVVSTNRRRRAEELKEL
jgi:ribose/xylose/arabinose/galactoside ABC-type transport system permease subunit